MPEPKRLRVDLRRSPAWVRYGLAVILTSTVALITRAVSTRRHPAVWYDVLVRAGAILLLVWAAGWLAYRLISHRRTPG